MKIHSKLQLQLDSLFVPGMRTDDGNIILPATIDRLKYWSRQMGARCTRDGVTYMLQTITTDRGVLFLTLEPIPTYPEQPPMPDHKTTIITDAELTALRKQARYATNRNAAALLKQLATKLEHLKCPHPKLQGSVPLIVYFGNEHDRDEFLTAITHLKPGLKAHAL